MSSVALGQVVAGATFCLGGLGGYAEFICLPASELVTVPAGVDPTAAVCAVVNYLTAHMAMHRTAHIRRGQRILVHSAIEQGQKKGNAVITVAYELPSDPNQAQEERP